MGQLHDILGDLPRFSWRGIEVPLTGRSARFAHDRGRHKYVFRDDEILEALGHKNWVLEYRIPFRQGIAKGPYRDLFVEVFPRFIDACRDRSRGELYDPVLGEFDAEVLEWDETLDVLKRDGTDVVVRFEHSPDPEAEESPGADLSNLASAENEAGRLDDAMGEVARSAQQEPPPPAVDPLARIGGFLRQIDRRGNQIRAQIGGFVDRVEAIEDAATDLEDPKIQPVIRSARRLRAAGGRLRERLANPVGALRSTTTRTATTLASLAISLGVTPDELLKRNPRLAAPLVPPGTEVFYQAP